LDALPPLRPIEFLVRLWQAASQEVRQRDGRV
jgi:hypothetical protein